MIIDGSLLRIDRVAMASGGDRPFYCGKHKVHGMNVQVIADPAGRLIWVSPALPGARHDIAAAREHGLIDAITAAELRVLADRGYQGAVPAVTVPQRCHRLDPDTGNYRAALREPERRQRRACPAPWPRRTRQRPAQDLEDPTEDPC